MREEHAVVDFFQAAVVFSKRKRGGSLFTKR